MTTIEESSTATDTADLPPGRIPLKLTALVLLVVVVVACAIIVQWGPIETRFRNWQIGNLASQLKFAEALEAADRLNRLAPGQPESLLLLCRLQRQSGQPRAALQTISKLADAGVPELRIQAERRLTAARLGDLESSEPFLSQLLTNDELDSRDVCEAFVIGYRTRYHMREAMALIDVWQNDFPQDYRPAAHRGMVAQMETNWAEAVAAYDQAVELGDRRTETLIRLGLCCLEINNSEQALTAFRLCAGFDPQSADAQLGIGDALSRSGQPDEAFLAYQRCLVLDPWRVEARLAVAKTLLDRRDLNAALTELELLVTAWPEDSAILFQYSQVLSALGRKADAEAAAARWKQADQEVSVMEGLLTDLRSQPHNTALRSRIGVLMIKHYSRSMAVPFLESVLADDPSDQNARESLAAYYTWRKEPERAALYLHSAGGMQP